jgi:phosphoglycerate kinase
MPKYIDEVRIENKKVFLRVDFNVTLGKDHAISNDERIRQALPTIKHLLASQNTLIVATHLGQPNGQDPHLTTEKISLRLGQLLDKSVTYVSFDKTFDAHSYHPSQAPDKIFLLDNIRFHQGEKKNDQNFAKSLAGLADVYVNDAFGVSHRPDASIVGVPKYLPHYGGLLLKKELLMIGKILNNPQKPVVAVLGGAKISTKINLIGRLMDIADYLLIGGGLANTFMCANNHKIGKSICEYDEAQTARRLMYEATHSDTKIIIPKDAIVGKTTESIDSVVKKIDEISDIELILDIGPETQAEFGNIIASAKTIIWNGPLGYVENPEYRRGTDFVYYSITQNNSAISVVGGGDTISAIAKEEYLGGITHISTGGGAMLEFIENSTLPGIKALDLPVST